MSSFWRSCLEYFQRELTPQEFTAWIKPIRCRLDTNAVMLEVPNRLALRWIKDVFNMSGSVEFVDGSAAERLEEEGGVAARLYYRITEQTT